MDSIPEASGENNLSIGEPQEKSSGTLKKFLNTSSWTALFLLAPITVLIFLSQDTVPGDLFYPIKRGMEGVVLAAASISPTTRVAFRTDLTERRFKEAEKLLLARADVTGLSDLVNEVQAAQSEISTLPNVKNKTDLTEKLIGKIDEYQNKLEKIQTSAPPATFPTPTEAPTPTSVQALISPSQPPQPTMQPTATPVIPQASPTEEKIQPSPTPSIPPGNTVGIAIDDTKKRLEEIKKRLKEKREETEDTERHLTRPEEGSSGKRDNKEREDRGRHF